MTKAEIMNELLQGKEVTHSKLKTTLTLNDGRICNRKGYSMLASDYWGLLVGEEDYEEGWYVVLNLFTDEFLEEIGFKRQHEHEYEDFGGVIRHYKVVEPYGRAVDKRTNGMTVLTWNREGHHVTYFGEPLEPNVTFCIGKDGGTRYAFNGYVFSQDDVRQLLKLTW